MIKCNASVTGTVNRPADIKNGRDGKPFITFGMRVRLEDGRQAADIDISVACDGEDDDVLSISAGDRVKVEGVMTFKHLGDSLFYNLAAEKVSRDGAPEDSVSGTLQFRGTIGSKGVIEKQGKKGSFRIFDAYSAEKVVEEQYSYVWVHFLDFTDARPGWLAPRAGINAEGRLELQPFNGRITVNCRVESLSKWDKENSNQ